MSPYNVPDWKQRLAADLKRDKKKTAVLAVLVLVAVIMGGRLLLGGAETPQAASGAYVAPSDAAPTVATPVAPKAGDLTDKIALHQMLNKGQRKITQDIFKPSLDVFPLDEKSKPAVVVAVATTQEAQPTTGPSAAELEAKAIRAQAASLTLQSTVISETSTAIINGRVLRKGDWINNFEVVEITARSCVVVQNGIRIALEMRD